MTKHVVIIGGGPSGLMAAEKLSSEGYNVTVYERKASFARKFLMAGRGGLNITHSEDIQDFINKYGAAENIFKPIIEKFAPQNMREWCLALGEETFIGSSGRVFPKSFKASPLLRSWLARLEEQGVKFKPNHDWQGWDGKDLIFKTSDTLVTVPSDATLLALGGASWPRLGADGSWVKILEKEGVEISPLRPSNCGFFVNWSDFFSNKFSGVPLKSVTFSFQDKIINGECILTDKGIEGGTIYALSAYLRNEIDDNGCAMLTLDLKPDLNEADIIKRLQKPRRRMSLSNFLRKTLNLSDVSIGLLMEKLDRKNLSAYTAEQLTAYIKSYSVKLNAPFSLDRAISTAGGIKFNSLDENFMLINKPGVFITGEMLDWEAPTGGYLLQASMAHGSSVGNSMSDWLRD